MASEIKVDTISEKTSANGVTIDGVSLKDSKIATANSVDSDAYVDGSIDTAHIDALQVTGAKLNTDVISAQTELAAEPADTDELLVSDAGVLKRIDYSLIKAANTPFFMARLASDQSLTSGTDTIYQGQASIDTASGWDDSGYTYTVPNDSAGYWFIWGQSDIRQDQGDSNLDQAVAFLSVNSLTNNLNQFTASWGFSDNPANNAMPTFANIINLSAADVLRMLVRGNVNSGTPRCDSEHSWFGGYKLIG